MAQKIWLKRVLIPFLVIDILFTLIYIANAIIILIAVSQLTDDDFNDTYFVQNGNDEYTNGQYQDAKRLTTAVGSVLLAVSAISVLFDIVAIILWARHRLMPATLVGFNATKSVFWLAMLLLAIFRFSLGFIWAVVLLAMSIGQLIYASIILHRFRKDNLASRGMYAPAVGGSQPPAAPTMPSYHDPAASQEPMRYSAGGPKTVPGAATEYYGPPPPVGGYEMQNAQTGYQGGHNV